MEEKKTFIVQDENGIQSVAELLTVLEISGIEYAVYSIDKDQENSDIYAAKIVKDVDGNDKIVSIEDEDERKRVFQVVDNMISE